MSRNSGEAVFWVMCTADVADSGTDIPEIGRWHRDNRLSKGLELPGCTQAWLLYRPQHAPVLGTPLPALAAVYEVRDPSAFASAHFVVPEWHGYGKVVRPRSRSVRKVISTFDFSDIAGKWWTIVRIGFESVEGKGPAQEDEFNHWYTFVHVPTVCAKSPEMRRVWRVGSPEHRGSYWAVWECEEVSDMRRPASAPAGPAVWSEPWRANIREGSWSRSHHQLVAHLTKL